MINNIFEAAKTISALEIAERYAGTKPTTTGAKTKARCPIHAEQTASCFFYPNGSFFCFGCHAGGTAIDMAARLFNCTPYEAARKICADYGLTYDTGADTEQIRARHKIAEARAAIRQATPFVYAVHCALVRWCDDRLKEINPADETDNTLAQIESLLDYRAESNNILDAIDQLQQQQKEGNLYALLSTVFTPTRDKYEMLKTWDDTQRTNYAEGVPTL